MSNYLRFLFCAASLLISSFTYVSVPKAYLRDDPVDFGHIESEAFYSEPVNVLKSEENWAYVQMLDNERGWLKNHQIINKSTAYPSLNSAVVYINRLAAHVYDREDTEYGPMLTLPFESVLEIAELPQDPNSRWIKIKGLDGKEGYIQRGDIVLQRKVLSLGELVDFSKQFLGLPYTWGGRCSLGYDCSGFVQMLYRQMGIDIPRNSKDQVNWNGFIPVPIQNLSTGDLIFFGPENGKITHVGMSLGYGEFIHASPKENKPYLQISKVNVFPWDGSAPYYSYRVGRALRDKR